MSDAEKPTFVYRAARAIFRFLLKVLYRFKTSGDENIPLDGGCIIVANHVSYFDPPVVACGTRRRTVHFMARDTLSRSRINRWFFTSIETIPIDRTRGDVGALRRGLHLLGKGSVLGFFPEGTRSVDGELHPAKGGIGFLIAKAEVPVVPAYIGGTYRAFPKGAKFPRVSRVSIVYGPPVMPAELLEFGNDRESYEKIGQLVMSRIAALKASQT